MRRAGEVDAPRSQRLLRGVDVVDGEVEDRRGLPVGVVLAMQVEADASRVEEGQVAEGEDVREAEDLAVEALGARDVPDRERDLADGSDSVVCVVSVISVRLLPCASALVAGMPGQWRSSRAPTPSLSLMLARWYFTASTLVPRRRAISARDIPWRTQSSTSPLGTE